MGCRELIDSLCKEGEDKLTRIRQEAEEEAGRTREDVQRQLREVRAGFDRMLADSVREHAEAVLAGAEREARMTLLRAEKELADRLHDIAVRALPVLRTEGYADIFRALVSELPSLEWETVRVCPEDVSTAQGYYPNASLISDNTITGGLEVMASGGRVCVINTLGKRLENAWSGILPQVMREIHEECRE